MSLNTALEYFNNLVMIFRLIVLVIVRLNKDIFY